MARTFLIRSGRPTVAPDVVEDRRRTSADLKAGVVPALDHLVELADGDPTLLAAAERARDELAAIVDWLGSPSDEPLDLALARAAGWAAEPHGMAVETELTPGLTVDDATSARSSRSSARPSATPAVTVPRARSRCRSRAPARSS